MRNSNPAIPPPVIEPCAGGAIEFPNENDVLSGRGGRINNHEGNVNFRTLVAKVKIQYLSRQTKKPDKAVIAANLVDQIRKLDPPGRFLKEDVNSGVWYEVGDERARRKTGQALREDAPEIKEEMMEIEGEMHRSKLSKLTMMSGQIPFGAMVSPGPAGNMYPSMPFPPMFYPGPMYYPQMCPPQYPSHYPVPLPGTIPQASLGTTPQVAGPARVTPFSTPVMTAYMYPPTPIYLSPLSVVIQPTIPAQQHTQAQVQQPHHQQKQQSESTSTAIETTRSTDILNKQEKDNYPEIVTNLVKPQLKQIVKVNKSKPEEISSNNSIATHLTKSDEAMMFTKMNSCSMSQQGHPVKLHVNSNNSSQTDITLNSSSLSENTEMDAESYEFQHNIQIPINNAPLSKSASSKRSKRSQWRDQLQENSHNFFQQQPTIEDLPNVISTTSYMEDNRERKYMKFSDRRSSNSLPPVSSSTFNSYLISSPAASEKNLNVENSTIDLLTSYRSKSLSLTDIDVIQTLASMSGR